MKLTEEGLKDRAWWEDRGYQLPGYDRADMIGKTRKAPVWIHFGAGNIFRAFPCAAAQSLLNRGLMEKGIVVAEGFDHEIISKINRPHDDYSILVTLKADGTVEKTVIGSVAESLPLDPDQPEAFGRLKEIFTCPSLQMATFTITEKGYSLTDGSGELLKDVAFDLKAGPERPKSYMGKVAALLYARSQAGRDPIAMVSADNCSHNGDRLREAVLVFAKAWTESGAARPDFLAYVEDRRKVSFPWTMIDKITPRPDDSVKKILLEDGVEDVEPVVTQKNSYTAPFVNGEECQYLVIEDDFPGGRPPLDRAGIIFTDRKTVDLVEKMKVCACLNPLHTALAVFGCLLGFTRISDEMKDPELKKLVEIMGRREGLLAIADPGVIKPEEFLDTVLTVRLPNPFIPDSPQRIATDTSQKLAVRFGETIKTYAQSPDLQLKDLKMIPLVLAGWLRYLMAVDDAGRPFELSPDPLLKKLLPALEGLKLGEPPAADPEKLAASAEILAGGRPGENPAEMRKASGILELLRPILRREDIFGVDLCALGMDSQICGYLAEMTAGLGSVRAALRRHIKEAETQ